MNEEEIREAFEAKTQSQYEGDFTKYTDGDYVNDVQQDHWIAFREGYQTVLSTTTAPASDTMLEDIRMKDALRYYERLRPAREYHEDDSCVLWWKLPVEEPPYCGTPNDEDWKPQYYTHFSMIIRNSVLQEANAKYEAQTVREK